MIYHGHEGLLDDIPYAVTHTTAALRPHKTRFDFIAVTGMSGVLIGSPVAIRLKMPLVVVRKPEEISHSCNDVIGVKAARGRYVFIDDFISLGTTYARVRERLAAADLDCRYVGAYLYSERLLSWDGDGKTACRAWPPGKQRPAAPLSAPVSPPLRAAGGFTTIERKGAERALRGILGAPYVAAQIRLAQIRPD